MKAHQQTVGKSDTWLTPREITDKLGWFHLDPCAAPPPWNDRAKVNLFAPTFDGLSCGWGSNSMKQAIGNGVQSVRVWCNPPFNRYERPKWMAKMAEHGNGIMLIPAATETEAFFKYVWSKADAVCFLRGRPHFLNHLGQRAKANCGCSIALVAYGQQNVDALRAANLGHVLSLK